MQSHITDSFISNIHTKFYIITLLTLTELLLDKNGSCHNLEYQQKLLFVI